MNDTEVNDDNDVATELQRHIDQREEGGYGIECPDCGTSHHLVYVRTDGTAEVYRRIGETDTGAGVVELMQADAGDPETDQPHAQIH